MGAYNILTVGITCESCKQHYITNLQFRFGDTWQHQYVIGDNIKWGGNDIGNAGLEHVKVYGLAETSICPNCGHPNSEEYDIIVNNDKIIGVRDMQSLAKYGEGNEGNYYIDI